MPDGILRNELDIDSEVLKALPIVPAGNSAGKPKKPRPLPTGDNWLSELWLSCYCVMSDAAGMALLKITKHRLVSTANAKALPGDIPLSEKQQNTFSKRMWESIKRIAPKALAGSGVAAAAGFILLKLL